MPLPPAASGFVTVKPFPGLPSSTRPAVMSTFVRTRKPLASITVEAAPSLEVRASGLPTATKQSQPGAPLSPRYEPGPTTTWSPADATWMPRVMDLHGEALEPQLASSVPLFARTPCSRERRMRERRRVRPRTVGSYEPSRIPPVRIAAGRAPPILLG